MNYYMHYLILFLIYLTFKVDNKYFIIHLIYLMMKSTESISSLFPSTSSSFGAKESSLGDIFSESVKEKFARKIKPAELDIEKRPLPEAVAPPKKEKKKKWKNRTPEEVAEAAAAAASAGVNERKRKADKANMSIGESDSPAAKEATQQEIEARTIFVGNIPLSESTKSVKKLFTQFGVVDSVRFRSVPIAGTAVDDAGNQDLVRKVCVNHREFGEQKGSFNAYVVFASAASIEPALALNNFMIGKRHLRVDRSTPTLFDPKRSVFIGSLPHYADEEDLRNHLATVRLAMFVLTCAQALMLFNVNGHSVGIGEWS
jgi:hypothetical protein